MASALSVELWFEVYLGKEKDKNVYSYKIWNLTDTIHEQCEPLDGKLFGVIPEEMAMNILMPLSLVPSLGTMGTGP